MSPYDAQSACMTNADTLQPAPRLILESQISEIDLLWPWVESLAAAYAIPPDTLFAIHLCLEESVSNVIRHGYQGQPGHHLTVDFSLAPANAPATNGSANSPANSPANILVFTVEDQAPPFNPLEDLAVPAMPAAGSIDRLNPGGHGIRLLRKFAADLDYQRLANGNRLTIRFTLPA